MAAKPSTLSPATVFARPTAGEVWLGPAQRSALARLLKGPSLRFLSGAASTGKSALLSHAAARLSPGTVVLHCAGPRAGTSDVLRALLASAELEPAGLCELDQRNLLSVFIQHRRSQGKRVMIVVDDAHLLAPDAWRELDRLSRVSVGGEAAAEVLGAGRPDLEPQLEALAEDGALAYSLHRLDPPSTADVTAYIGWRLRRYGLDDLFTPLASQLVARLGGGRFGAIDVLCQMAMLLARELDVERIDAHTVRQAILTLSTRRTERARPKPAGAEADTPPARLFVSREGQRLRRVELGPRTMIGRSEHNDVALPSPHLSRHHAAIVGTPAGYYIVDLNSANGIEVNGRRAERAVLADLDIVTIGPYRLKIRIDSEAAVGDPLPSPDSLADTGRQPTPLKPSPPIRRVK